MSALVLRNAVGLTLTGAIVGGVMAYAAHRFMSAALYGDSPTSMVPIGVAVLVMTGVAAVAAFVPVRRAARVDPCRTLRAE